MKPETPYYFRLPPFWDRLPYTNILLYFLLSCNSQADDTGNQSGTLFPELRLISSVSLEHVQVTINNLRTPPPELAIFEASFVKALTDHLATSSEFTMTSLNEGRYPPQNAPTSAPGFRSEDSEQSKPMPSIETIRLLCSDKGVDSILLVQVTLSVDEILLISQTYTLRIQIDARLFHSSSAEPIWKTSIDDQQPFDPPGIMELELATFIKPDEEGWRRILVDDQFNLTKRATSLGETLADLISHQFAVARGRERATTYELALSGRWDTLWQWDSALASLKIAGLCLLLFYPLELIRSLPREGSGLRITLSIMFGLPIILFALGFWVYIYMALRAVF